MRAPAGSPEICAVDVSNLRGVRKAGIDLKQLAADLQAQGAKSFDESWQNLLGAIETKAKNLQTCSHE